DQERDAGRADDREGDEADDPLGAAPPPEPDRQRGAEQRQQDGECDQGGHDRASRSGPGPCAAWRRSSRSSSTSSSAVINQLRYARVSKNAITPKVITIAVSTNACGSGSAKPAVSSPTNAG